MNKYIVQRSPLRIPTNDGKTILEHFGVPSTGTAEFSFAHMIAPPKWSEPFQSPEFDEITFVIRGKKQIEIDDEKIILNENESILVRKGTRVRYSNPFDEPVEYVSVCIPAFSIEKVHREIE
ncbi:MAG: cupin domain-containing protein [Ignavibacteria bacterium]|jgi:mannose-6-phosphate isomerase-like protein (cupin superfamily)|nr:cupin domain-containing protein [Ignavibacteria bacterium]MDH7527782.1 cupin domain-containing protein [Ignavibacteria bacterium]